MRFRFGIVFTFFVICDIVTGDSQTDPAALAANDLHPVVTDEPSLFRPGRSERATSRRVSLLNLTTTTSRMSGMQEGMDGRGRIARARDGGGGLSV